MGTPKFEFRRNILWNGEKKTFNTLFTRAVESLTFNTSTTSVICDTTY